MSSAQLKAKMFEKKAREAAEPPGKKEVVWTPQKDSEYVVQTAKKPAKGPPPKKNLSQLP